jgi:pimeloyl-ACP methyl ester carboxylesterase
MPKPKTTPQPDWPDWKTPEGKAEFLTAYRRVLRLWPAQTEDLYVPTRWGQAHVLAYGPREAPPLVLLHGFFATAAMWYANAAALGQTFRVYAPDIVGQPGLTEAAGDVAQSADLNEWLLDVFGGLAVERAHVAGLSYGGWLATSLALYAPHKVERLALLAPAGTITGLRRRFMLFALPMIVWPVQATIRPFFSWLAQGYRADGDFASLMELGVRHWRSSKQGVYPAAFSDEELRRLEPPTLLLIGDREVIYNQYAGMARARRLIPHFEGEIVPNACHLISAEQADVVNRRMLAFLGIERGEAVLA